MMERNTIAGVSVLYYFLLLLNSISAQVTIMTQPMNVTVCLSQNTTANFTCVVDGGSRMITTAGWQILDDDIYLSVVGRPRHMIDPRSAIVNIGTIVTETLTIINVSVSDNGAKYRCQPISGVISDVVTLTVIAPPAITIEVNEICTNDFNVSWTPASNEEGLSYDVILLRPGMMNDISLESAMDTSFNFTGLIPNTAYSITVASELNSCSGTRNITMLTTATVEAGVPQSVSNLGSSERTRNTITVVWGPADSPNCGSVLYYTVTIVNSVDDNDRNTTELSGTRTEFSNLINGTHYTISVAAINRAGTGQTSTINVTTLTDEEANNIDNDGDGDGGGLSGGAIAGIVIAVIAVIGVGGGGTIIIVVVVRKNHNKDKNGGILNSNSPESTSPVKSGKQTNEKRSDSKEQHKTTGKNKPKTKNTKQANKTEYAELHLSGTGTAPSVDPTKVDYTEVKEHEPLSYAQIQHEPRAGNKPVQGAPQVEYKEVWHQ